MDIITKITKTQKFILEHFSLDLDSALSFVQGFCFVYISKVITFNSVFTAIL